MKIILKLLQQTIHGNVVNQPSSSNLQLIVNTNSKSSLLTPTVAGQYKISATPTNGDVIETQFSISNQYPFDQTQLEGFDATQELSSQTGIVSNQLWIYSKSLNRSAIEAVVLNYQGFEVIDYDEIRGLLVQFDESSAQSQIDITKIRAATNIDSVDRRKYEGKDSDIPAVKLAEDGSDFDDGGDNWHLEHIGITDAWDVTTGNDTFYIGIADAYNTYHTEHEDLIGRFREATRATEIDDENIDEDLLDDINVAIEHGTAVAGSLEPYQIITKACQV